MSDWGNCFQAFVAKRLIQPQNKDDSYSKLNIFTDIAVHNWSLSNWKSYASHLRIIYEG